MDKLEIKTALLRQAVLSLRGDKLLVLYAICENQKTISTKKLEYLLDEIHEKMKVNAIELKNIFDSI